MQKENLFFFSFPRPSKFGEAKVMKKSDLRLELDIVTPLTRSVCSAKRTKKNQEKQEKQFGTMLSPCPPQGSRDVLPAPKGVAGVRIELRGGQGVAKSPFGTFAAH